MEKMLPLELKQLLLVVAIMVAAGRFACAEQQDASPPNVLLIAVDDLRPELAPYRSMESTRLISIGCQRRD